MIAHREIFRAWGQGETNVEEMLSRYREWKITLERGQKNIKEKYEKQNIICQEKEKEKESKIGNQLGCKTQALSVEDKKVLADLDFIQKQGSQGKTILTWVPIVNVLTAGRPLEAVIIALQEADGLDELASAVSNMDKLVACKSVNIIMQHKELSSEAITDCSSTFFNQLEQVFDRRCTN